MTMFMLDFVVDPPAYDPPLAPPIRLPIPRHLQVWWLFTLHARQIDGDMSVYTAHTLNRWRSVDVH